MRKWGREFPSSKSLRARISVYARRDKSSDAISSTSEIRVVVSRTQDTEEKIIICILRLYGARGANKLASGSRLGGIPTAFPAPWEKQGPWLLRLRHSYPWTISKKLKKIYKTNRKTKWIESDAVTTHLRNQRPREMTVVNCMTDRRSHLWDSWINILFSLYRWQIYYTYAISRSRKSFAGKFIATISHWRKIDWNFYLLLQVGNA